MFEVDQTAQPALFATSPRDWLAEDSDVWVYIDLFKELDLSAFFEDYSPNGRPSKNPEYLLRSLFYGLTHRVTSVRALTEACKNDIRFIVLSGNQQPDRRTFDRFIRRHAERMEKLFVQVVELASRAGMVTLGRLALDGSRFKAKANRRNNMQYGKMDRAIDHIKEDLEELKQSLEEAETNGRTEEESRISKDLLDKQKRLERIRAAKGKIEEEFKTRTTKNNQKDRDKVTKCLADPEAQAMAGKGEGFNYGYNAQIVVDSENQIIVAADIHDSPADFQALPKMLDQVEEVCGSESLTGAEIMADFGYRSANNISDIEERGAECFIPHKSNSKQETATHFAEQIVYDKASDTIKCLAGKNLRMARHNKPGIECLTLNLKKGECEGCLFASECEMWKDGKQRRDILIPSKKNLTSFQRSMAFSRTDEFLEKYRRRKAIVEPVFGNIKNKGIRIFVTGLDYVKIWWKMACIAHNLEKLARKRSEPIFSAVASHIFYTAQKIHQKFSTAMRLNFYRFLASI